MLVDRVEAEWKSLKMFKYEILLKPKKGQPTQQFSDINQLKKDCKLVIRKLSKGFSKYQDELKVLGYIGAMMMSSDYISSIIGDPDFPVISSDVISDDTLRHIAESVVKELELRKEVIEIQQATP